MRELLLASAKSYYIGVMNRHISNVEILLTNSVGIGEHQDIQESIDKELEKISIADDKLGIIKKYLEKQPTKGDKENDTKEEKKPESK